MTAQGAHHMTYKLDSTYHGFDHRGAPTASSRTALYFSSKAAATAHAAKVVQPSGYHGAGCSIIFRVSEVVIDRGEE